MPRKAVVAIALASLVFLAAGFFVGRWSEPQRDTKERPQPPIANEPKTLFGMSDVVAVVQATPKTAEGPGSWIGVGCTASPDNTYGGDLVVAGGAPQDGRWLFSTEVVYDYPLCGECGGEIADELMPESRALVVHCHIGGTDGVSSVLVVGVSDRSSLLKLAVSCGGTHAEVDGDTLAISSRGPAAGAIYPSPQHPDFRLRWNGRDFGLEGPEQEALFGFFCDEGGGYHEKIRYNPPFGAIPLSTQLGTLVRIGPAVFADYDTPQCGALWHAWDPLQGADPTDFEAHDLNPDPSPIATAIGIPPPPGETDWYFDCYIDVLN